MNFQFLNLNLKNDHEVLQETEHLMVKVGRFIQKKKRNYPA